MCIATNIEIQGNYFGKVKSTKSGKSFTALGRKAIIENVYELIDENEIVFLKLSTIFLGKKKTAYIPMSELTEAKSCKSLADLGFDITNSNFMAFVDSIRIQLEELDAENIAPTYAYRNLGWIRVTDDDGKIAYYYRAYDLIGSSDPAFYMGKLDVEPHGLFQTWKTMIMNDVIPYQTLQIVLIAALSSVVVGLLSYSKPMELPIVHLNLPSGKGKSTAGYLATSIMGRPFEGTMSVKDDDGRTIMRNSLYGSWGSTDNALIAAQSGNRGAVVVLNELGKSLSKNFARIILDLSEGSDKLRMNGNFQTNTAAGFATSFISTGESSILEKCDSKQEGLAIRVLELSSELTKDSEHANRIKEISYKHHGHAAPKLAKHIIKNGGIGYLLSKYKANNERLCALFSPSPSKERFVEKFPALFLTTAEIATEALGIPFNIDSLLNFFLKYDAEHGAERDTSAESYAVIIELCKVNLHKFVVKYDKSYPKHLVPNTPRDAPRNDCWGRINYTIKYHNNKVIIEEIEIRKRILEKLLMENGYISKTSCIAAWRRTDVLDVQDDNHPCRKRKIDPNASLGTNEPVYVFRVYASEEDLKVISSVNTSTDQELLYSEVNDNG